MSRWFVSRHQGARQWAQERGLAVDCWVDHLQIEQLAEGDCVYGSLPVSLAAAVIDAGARYFHLTLNLPRELRGRELTASELRQLDAHFQEFSVTRVGKPDVC